MARVIVILALLFLITAGIFALTRPPAGLQGGSEADGRTTVALPNGPTAATGTSDASVASAQDVLGRPSAGAGPVFSTAGIDHRGRVSFTGTAAPGDRLSISHDGRILGRGRADGDGNWTIGFKIPAVIEAYALTVRSHRGDGDVVDGPQHALVSPPAVSGGLPVIAIEAAKPSPEAPFADPGPDGGRDPQVGIIIETVNADDRGGVKLAGRADPGATLRLEMAGRPAGSARVGRDGRWSLEAANNTGAEVKTVRVVLVSAGGRELDSSSLPLRLPAPVLAMSAGKGTAARAAEQAPARGQKGRWIKVRRGDSLWKLAQRHYGDGAKWTRIFKANRRRVQDPDLILTGWRLRLP